MTRRLALWTFLPLLWVCPLGAQTQIAGNLGMSASIRASLTLAVTGSTDFGLLPDAPGTRNLDPRSPSAGGSVAQVLVTGDPNADISVTFPTTIELEYFDGASVRHVMPVTPRFSTDPSGNQGGSSLIAAGSVVQLNAEGRRYLWLGGDLVVGSNQRAGTYVGTVTVTVSY